MKPHLANADLVVFKKYLKNATTYFEFGSGGSTHLASSYPNIKKIYTVESDSQWLDRVKNNIKSNNIQYFYADLNTKPNSWGNPGPHCSDSQKRAYSECILQLKEPEQKNIDLVMIDGRFRVACCLKSLKAISKDCVVCFDDFLNREKYHVVLKYFDVIEKTSSNRMVFLKKKDNVQIDEQVIRKYELIQG